MDGTDDETLSQGAFLRRRRNDTCRTQRWVAEAADISERTVIRAEKDDDISAENLLAICSVLDIDPADVPPTGASRPPNGSRPDDVLHEAAWKPAWMRIAGVGAAATACFLTAACVGALVTSELRSDGLASVNLTLDGISTTRIADGINRIAATAKGPADPVRTRSALASAEGGALHHVALCRPYERCASSSDRLGKTGNRVWQEGGATTLVVGPMSPRVVPAVARQLDRDPSVSIRFAIADADGAQEDGTLWFDPRGLSDGQMRPLPPGGRLLVRIERR